MSLFFESQFYELKIKNITSVFKKCLYKITLNEIVHTETYHHNIYENAYKNPQVFLNVFRYINLFHVNINQYKVW